MEWSYKQNVFGECHLTPEGAAYVAGFIDGEGTISLRAIRTTERRSHQFSPHLSVSNTHLPTLEMLVELTGNGSIRLSKTPDHHKTGYRWALAASQIRRVLPQIEPYLFQKRDRARLLLEYFALQDQGRSEGWAGIAEEDHPRVQAIYEEIALLNQRGLVRATPVEFELRERKRRDTICQVDGCERTQYRGELWCYAHWRERREPILKTCEHCGGEMDASRPNQRFCSGRCQAQAYRKNVTKPREEARPVPRKQCPGCEEYFDVTNENRDFCSVACKLRLYRAQARAKAYGLPIPETITEAVFAKDVSRDRNCVLCGTAFETNNAKRVYCSQNCVLKASQRKKRAEEAGSREIRLCPECGKAVDPGDKRRKYCSVTCQNHATMTRYLEAHPREVKAGLPEKSCAHCGTKFQPQHRSRIYCGPACLQAAYHIRKNQRE